MGASTSTVQQDLMDRMRMFEIDQTAANAWKETLGTMLEGVRAGGTQIETTRTSAIQTTKRLERSALRVRTLKLVSAVVPDVPTVNDALLVARRNRAALINLILALLLLVPIVFANAQLTGLVLRELIPPAGRDCAFDFTLAWRTDRDFRVAKKKFEPYFYPAGDRQLQ